MNGFSITAALRGEYHEIEGTGHCQKHGEFKQRIFLESGPGSPEIGRIPLCLTCAADKRAAVDAEEDRRRRLQLLAAAGIPPRFRDSAFDGYRVDHVNRGAWGTITQYRDAWPAQVKSGQSLIMIGPPGVGKTHLSVAMLLHVISAGETGRYVTTTELVRDVRATWRSRSGPTEGEVIAGYANTHLLVLDEAGVQFGSDAEKVTLFDVLDARYRKMRPTIVCGNCTIPELEQCLGERIIDRLRENGGVAVALTGASQRRKSLITSGAEQ